MSESLFQISCPSCESVFAVTDPELVGQIIACPKCGGMMLVEAAEVERSAGNSEDASFGEAGENEADGEDFAGVPKAPVVDEARSEETGDADANGEEEEKSKNRKVQWSLELP